MSDQREGDPVHMKLLIDKRHGRVILAEAGKDFVDILYSFLTLPLGTITRLVRKQPSSPSAVTFGCFNNLYASVENLPTKHFRTEACKRMLLHPRNVKAEECQKLKVNLDCTENPKYYICSDVTCGARNHGLVSYFETARCTCGKLMDMEIFMDIKTVEVLKGSDTEDFEEEGVLLFITDTLKIFPKSAAFLLTCMHLNGINSIKHLEERIVEVGFQEVSSLLKCSLTSDSALTDTFLRKQKLNRTTVVQQLPYSSMPQNQEIIVASKNHYLSMKVLRRKSTGKVFYAEVTAEFVDLLFTCLTIPLFSALVITEANAAKLPGCITHLLPVIVNAKCWQVRGVLPPLYSCHPLLPNILPLQPPTLSCHGKMNSENQIIVYRETDNFLMNAKPMEKKRCLRLLDPKAPDAAASSEASNSAGYVKKPSMFLVWNDMSVKPLNGLSLISLMEELDCPFDDVEKVEVSIGEQEVLCLLRESIFTSSALASLLNFMHKDPKQVKQ